MLSEIRQYISSHPEVTLVAVSKYQPIEALKHVYAEGQRIFGESRVQELQAKAALMPADVEWHFIGHLQRNKVKAVVALASLIHSIDSERLLAEVNRQAEALGRQVDVLLQLHVAEEETKFGFSAEECRELIRSGRLANYPKVRVRGLMCMATNTDDTTRIRQDFHQAHELFKEFEPQMHWDIRSWGMSGDYPVAVEEGATHIRIGSMIFGERHY